MAEIQKIENLVELSYQLLKYQMGVELNTQLTLSETLEGYTSKLENTQVQAANPTNRIEYRQLEVQKTLQELDLKNQKVQRYPTLVGFASMGYTIGGLQFNQITKVKDWEPYMIVGLSLNVPIFSGMQSHYQIQQSSLKVKQVENNFSVLKRGIEFETSQANKNYQNVLSTLDTHKANIELAKEVFENTQIKYKEGYASNLEVLQAESDLKQAQSNYLGAVYDALVAKVALEKALGNLYK